MHCPRCSTQTADGTNFCNKCGLNLRPKKEKFDWSKTWVVEMLLSDDERLRRRAAAEIEEASEGVTLAELRSARELKNGIITAFAGVGTSIFFYLFFGALADVVAPKDPAVAAIFRYLWTAGIVAFMVGLGIIASALFVDKHALGRGRAGVASADARREGLATGELPALDAPPSVVPSVTEHTTDLLTEPAGKKARDSR